MDEQLSLLIQLQELDARIRALSEEKNGFPEALASLDRRRTASEEDLEKAKEALQAAQKIKRDKDKDLEAGLQKVEKLKARISEIKTNKEYQALLREIETATQENKAIEDEILSLMEKIDAASGFVKTAEKQAAQEDAVIQEEKRAYVEKSGALEAELKALTQSREDVASRIEPAVLLKYQKLLGTGAGAAVVEARAESCSGCYMSIPPQVYVNVKKNNGIINCPQCGRILYYKEAVVQKNT